MELKGKKRFKRDLEKFIITRLRLFQELPYTYNYIESEDSFPNVDSRMDEMDRFWEMNQKRYKRSDEEINFPQLTSHEICHEMFRNAFKGHSKMYIRIQNLNEPTGVGYDKAKKSKDRNGDIILQCSLLTLQMLDYDAMMFRAMNDTTDVGYRSAAQDYYCPYFFSYVIEASPEKYDELKEIQKKLANAEETLPVRADEPYIWMACTFNPDKDVPGVDFNGYVIQSSGDINKIRADIHIIEDEKIPTATVKDILGEYMRNNSCLTDDD